MTDRIRFIALVDFSPYSHTIAELGSRWCRIAGADLLLLHQTPGIVPALTDAETRLDIIAIEKTEVTDKLKKLAEDKFPGNDNVTFHVTDKKLQASIAELQKDDYDDFIIVGLKGTGMLKKIFMGSTAMDIINDMNNIVVAVPVKLCVGSGERCNLIPKNIVVTLNDRYPLNEAAFTSFLDAFKESIQHILFMSVIKSDESEEQSLQFLEEVCAKYRDRVNSGCRVFKGSDILEEIKTNVQAESDSVLVVQKGSRTFSDQLFRKFMVTRLVDDGSIPLVILP